MFSLVLLLVWCGRGPCCGLRRVDGRAFRVKIIVVFGVKVSVLLDAKMSLFGM